MVSVGYLARTIEEAGIPTVVIYPAAFRAVVEIMRPPRTVLSARLMGRPVGHPGDADGQRATIMAALRLLHDATTPGTIAEMPG
ncbi:MAG: hypothetical protein M3439_09715 [Chloroflexota bacterium]|nr:hypothetical protein [Chloroflexota bacterium]